MFSDTQSLTIIITLILISCLKLISLNLLEYLGKHQSYSGHWTVCLIWIGRGPIVLQPNEWMLITLLSIVLVCLSDFYFFLRGSLSILIYFLNWLRPDFFDSTKILWYKSQTHIPILIKNGAYNCAHAPNLESAPQN